MSLRKYLSDSEAKHLGLAINQKHENRTKGRYRISRDQWSEIQELRNTGILDACNNVGVDPSTSPMLWLKTKNESVRVTNPLFKSDIEKSYKELEEIAVSSVEKIISKTKPLKVTPKIIKSDYLFDVLVFTDVHIGMNPNPNGFSLYGGKWDEHELQKRLEIIVRETINEKRSNKLIIFDLGDFMDGWSGQTVRKGHELPQNMDNEKAFDVGLDFKVSLINSLAEHFQQIEMINICDDNHSGSFGYVVNSSFKRLVEHKYNSVKVHNQRKFISHYTYGNKVFISTHGKDGVNLRFGFKPILNSDQVEKIENYISEHELHGKDIYFIKGDSHQDIFDNSTSQKFKYWNFPALSPSSNWVQTNFKKGVSGFYNINFKEDKCSMNPYYFKWVS